MNRYDAVDNLICAPGHIASSRAVIKFVFFHWIAAIANAAYYQIIIHTRSSPPSLFMLPSLSFLLFFAALLFVLFILRGAGADAIEVHIFVLIATKRRISSDIRYFGSYVIRPWPLLFVQLFLRCRVMELWLLRMRLGNCANIHIEPHSESMRPTINWIDSVRHRSLAV